MPTVRPKGTHPIYSREQDADMSSQSSQGGKDNECVVSTKNDGGPTSAGDEELFSKCPVTEWLVLQTVFKTKGFKCEFKTLVSFL